MVVCVLSGRTCLVHAQSFLFVFNETFIITTIEIFNNLLVSSVILKSIVHYSCSVKVPAGNLHHYICSLCANAFLHHCMYQLVVMSRRYV